MSIPDDPRRLWTGNEDEGSISSVPARSVEWLPAPRQPARVDVASIRLRFAIAIALAALGMLIVVAALAALS